MKLDLPPLRDVIARHGLSAEKALGQNFLLDGQLLDRIARVPGSLEGQKVYEVGPGPGGLTRALIGAGAHVTAVERDRRCLPALAELGQAAPGRLDVIQGDALEIDEPAMKTRLQAAYDAAKRAGRFANTYAIANPDEYWAEGVQSWFDTNLTANPPNGIHGHIHTRAGLKAYDPALAALITEVFGDRPWRYSCPR